MDRSKKLDSLLNKEMKGISEQGKDGNYSYTHKEKATLKKIFDELK